MKAVALSLVLASIYFAACGGDDTPTKMDAQGSGSGSGSGIHNAAFGSACTVASDTSTECASGVCTDSIDLTAPVCSQKCTMLMAMDPSCPVGSMGQKCNSKGYCRP